MRRRQARRATGQRSAEFTEGGYQVGGQVALRDAAAVQNADRLGAAGNGDVEPAEPAPVEVELDRVLRGDPHRVGDEGERAGDGDRLRLGPARRQRDAVRGEEALDI